MDMVKFLLQNGAASDLKALNKVHLAPIDYTLKNSAERQFLLDFDPTLKDYLHQEEAEEDIDEKGEEEKED
jgi:hypothetical protein